MIWAYILLGIYIISTIAMGWHSVWAIIHDRKLGDDATIGDLSALFFISVTPIMNTWVICCIFVEYCPNIFDIVVFKGKAK